MAGLPDILTPGLDVVFCGTAVGTRSSERGHYYAGRGNRFYALLFESGFTPRLLTPDEDRELPTFGLGLTDLVKNFAQSHDRGLDFSGTPELEVRLAPLAPRWVAFTSKKAGGEAAKAFAAELSGYGEQNWSIAGARVFVLPSPSGASNRAPFDGRPTKISWWSELAELAGR